MCPQRQLGLIYILSWYKNTINMVKYYHKAVDITELSWYNITMNMVKQSVYGGVELICW